MPRKSAKKKAKEDALTKHQQCFVNAVIAAGPEHSWKHVAKAMGWEESESGRSSYYKNLRHAKVKNALERLRATVLPVSTPKGEPVIIHADPDTMEQVGLTLRDMDATLLDTRLLEVINSLPHERRGYQDILAAIKLGYGRMGIATEVGDAKNVTNVLVNQQPTVYQSSWARKDLDGTPTSQKPNGEVQ